MLELSQNRSIGLSTENGAKFEKVSGPPQPADPRFAASEEEQIDLMACEEVISSAHRIDL